MSHLIEPVHMIWNFGLSRGNGRITLGQHDKCGVLSHYCYFVRKSRIFLESHSILLKLKSESSLLSVTPPQNCHELKTRLQGNLLTHRWQSTNFAYKVCNTKLLICIMYLPPIYFLFSLTSFSSSHLS